MSKDKPGEYDAFMRQVHEAMEALNANTFFWVVAWLAIIAALVGSCLPVQAQVPAGAAAYKRQYTRIAHSEWGLDAPVSSLAAQLAQESGWRDGLVSRVGARGLSQFMPATATWIQEVRPDLRTDALYSPAWSMRAQVSYMKWLVQRVKPADNACEAQAFGESGFNGGESRVRARQRLSTRPGKCLDATCRINPGISAANQRENEDYPVRIERHWAPRFTAAGWGRKACA